jgi:hypothetical protein
LTPHCSPRPPPLSLALGFVTEVDGRLMVVVNADKTH